VTSFLRWDQECIGNDDRAGQFDNVVSKSAFSQSFIPVDKIACNVMSPPSGCFQAGDDAAVARRWSAAEALPEKPIARRRRCGAHNHAGCSWVD
jgi:hypothetical protein